MSDTDTWNLDRRLLEELARHVDPETGKSRIMVHDKDSAAMTAHGVDEVCDKCPSSMQPSAE